MDGKENLVAALEREQMMLGKEKFKVGQRVRPSAEGIAANLFSGTYRGKKKTDWSGEVIKVDQFNSPTVKWDAIKTPSGYAPWFITADRRRKRA